MSNHLDSLSNPLNIETIQEIDNLDLPIVQKHHLRILAHCLQILKIINLDNSLEYQNNNPLREWCDNQSKKFVTLKTIPFKDIDMLSIIIIGNSQTTLVDEIFLTPRGYLQN